MLIRLGKLQKAALLTVAALAVLPTLANQPRSLSEKIRLGQQIISTYPTDDATIEIDFARKLSAKSLVGFVHGMDSTAPSESAVTPLHPKLWRAGHLAEKIYARASKTDARFMLVISDLWGYPGADSQGKNWKAPYSNYGAWEEFVRKIARKARGKSITFEIWNEPDGSSFWRGTTEQWLETTKRAANVLKVELGATAQIAGPSLSRFDAQKIDSYVQYFHDHNLPLTALTWHEFRQDLLLPRMSDDIKLIRSKFIRREDTTGSARNSKEIIIGECVPEVAQFRPASNLAYLHYMEAASVDYSARGCWNESTGINNCWNCTLEGLLTPDTFRPRTTWWLYKLYADGVNSRVGSCSNDPRVVVLASGTDSGFQALIGYCGEQQICPAQKTITITLRGIPFVNGQGQDFDLLSIPNLNESALAKPVYIARLSAKPLNGVIRLKLPKLKLFDVYVLRRISRGQS